MTESEENKILRKENEDLKSQILLSQELNIQGSFISNLIDTIPNPIFIKNKNSQFVLCNTALFKFVNLTKEELYGKTDSDFFDKKQSDIFLKKDQEVIKSGKPNRNEEEITIDSELKTMLTSKVRLEADNGNCYILGTITDITENKKYELELEQKNLKIEKQKNDIETLFKEIHHRIKNNLQMVSSLLAIQMTEFEDESFKKAFQDSQNRIASVSKLHELFYKSSKFSSVNINHYLESIIDNIRHTYSFQEFEISTNFTDAPFDSEQSVIIGLIVSEIITNSFKHALVKNKKLEIYANLINEESKYILQIGDNGPEMSGTKSNIDSLGMKLINLLSDQISGELSIIKRDFGQHYNIVLSR